MIRVMLLCLLLTGPATAQTQPRDWTPEAAVAMIVEGMIHGLDHGLDHHPEIARLIAEKPDEMTRAALAYGEPLDWRALEQYSASERNRLERLIQLYGRLDTLFARRVLTEWYLATADAAVRSEDELPGPAERLSYLILTAAAPEGTPQLSALLLERWPNMSLREKGQVMRYLGQAGQSDPAVFEGVKRLDPQTAEEKALIDWLIDRLEGN